MQQAFLGVGVPLGAAINQRCAMLCNSRVLLFEASSYVSSGSE